MSTMLKLTGITKTFNPGTVTEKKAIRGIDLELEDGDFVTIIGGNGAGKSTLLNIIAGVHYTDTGSIELDGKNLTGRPEYYRAQFLGRVFQDPMMGTAANMEIEENLAMAMRRGKKRGLAWYIKDEEKALYDVYKSTNSAVASLVDGEDYVGAIDALKELAKPIDAFFDAVMVMDKDEAVKNNRLALLYAIDALVNKVADFSKIVL